MNLARIKSALDGIQDASLHSINTETMSGIEPLSNSTNASPAGSPRGVSSKLSMTHQQTTARTHADSLFSPVGDAKHEPDVVSALAGVLSDSHYRKSVSEPTTGEKAWRSIREQQGLSEKKHHNDRSQRTKADVHIAATSEMVVNRALFVKDSHRSHVSFGNNRGDTLSKSSPTSHAGLAANGSKKPIDFVDKAGFDGSAYHYNAQSDRINVEQQSPQDAFSIYSTDNMPPHYHDSSLTTSVVSKISQGQDEGEAKAPGFLSSRQQPSSSSPKVDLYSPQQGSYGKEFQNHQSIPPELAEIENLRQNLSNMITSPGLTQDESLSELLMLDKEHNKRQSTESTKTDSLLGAQLFQGISPSSMRLDSGLASYQPSHVTSSQKSGASMAESSISKENRVLREGLERERCRRRHCEDQIATLQGRILETQQLLAVAQATEKKKDNMIAQLDKTMAKVSASLKHREQEKITMVDKLKAANDALLQETEKQKIIIREQDKELVDSRQNCEHYQQSERAFRDQLKQHQAESAKRWEEAQKMAQLTNKQMESMGEDCLKAERQLKQVQATLASEREVWKQKEVELEQKVSSMEMKQTASLDEMQRLLQEERRTVDELNKDLKKTRREADDSRKEKENALREKEKLSLELSVEKARWEAKLQKQEAEIHAREESKMAEKVEKIKREAEEMEEMLRDGQRKQISEMSERHMEELRVQKDVHQREMMHREQRWADKQQQYQTRLAECQQEILKLSTKIEKVQQQRFGIVSKLQHFLQSQCNEAVMMVSSLESSPQTPINRSGQVTGQQVYAKDEVRVHDHQESKVKNARGLYSSIEDQHSEQLKRAQEEARQAIQRLYLHKQELEEEAPHEASFYPLDTAPSTPTSSEVSQSTVYQDINTSHLYTAHQQITPQGSQPITQSHLTSHSNGLDQRPNTIHHTRVNGIGMSKRKFTTPMQSSRSNQTNNGFGGAQIESGWMEVDQSDTGVFLEMMTDEHQDTKTEQDIVDWMSRHNSTLTSSPTKESPSPDLNIQPGQGLLLHIPGTSRTPGNTQAKGHDMSDLSIGPLDMLDSPVSSTQGDWREVALQKYIAKLLEQSPGSAHPCNPSQVSFKSHTGKSVIEKERIHSGMSHVTMEHHQPGRSDDGRGALMKTSRQVCGASKGLVNKDKLKKLTGPLNTGQKTTTNRPRSTIDGGRDNTGNQNKSSQKTKVWR